LYDTKATAVGALTEGAVAAALPTPPSSVVYDKAANAPTMAGTGAAKVFTFPKVTVDIGDAAIRKASDTYFCTAISLTDLQMCKTTYDATRRLSAERRLPAAEYNVKAQMAARDAFVSAKTSGAAAAVTTSGASAFGIAVAIGLVALY
jgi:hypothetical protein